MHLGADVVIICKWASVGSVGLLRLFHSKQPGIQYQSWRWKNLLLGTLKA